MRATVFTAIASLAFISTAIVPAAADVLIRVDKNDQRMTVSVGGETRYSWPVSTGTTGYETPGGSFRVSRLERTYFSRKYDNAPMPHAIFFTAYGHAIHGTTHGRNLGRAASHGCVRLSLRNAATLFSIVKSEGMVNIRVVIEGGDAVTAYSSRSGVRAASRPRYDGDDVMSAGMQMGRATRGDYDAFAPWRENYRQRNRYGSSYGYGDGYAPIYGYD